MQHRIFLKLSLLALLFFLLTGCMLAPVEEVSPAPTQQESSLPAVGFTQTPSAPTALIATHPPSSCLGGGHPQQNAERPALVGTMFVEDTEQGEYYLLQASDFTKRLLPIPPEANVIGFSPDHRQIAFQLGEQQNQIGILSLSGEQRTVEMDIDQLLNRMPEGTVVVGIGPVWWMDDQRLQVIVFQSDSPESLTFYPWDFVFNLETETWEFDWLDELPDVVESSEFFFSPDMSRVFYNAIYESGKDFVLWDRLQKRELLNGTNAPDYLPQVDDRYHTYASLDWSDDSKKFAFVDGTNEDEGIRILSRDGIELAYLRAADFTSHITWLIWSPSGRYLTFLNQADSEMGLTASVYIYDSKVGQLILQCPILADEITGIRWSPDEEWITFSSTQAESHPVLVNLQNGQVLQLAENFVLLEWLADGDLAKQ